MARLRRKRIYMLMALAIVLLLLAFELGLQNNKRPKQAEERILPGESPRALKQLSLDSSPLREHEAATLPSNTLESRARISKDAAEEEYWRRQALEHLSSLKYGALSSEAVISGPKVPAAALAQPALPASPTKQEPKSRSVSPRSVHRAISFDTIKLRTREPAVAPEAATAASNQAWGDKKLLFAGTFIPITLVTGIDSDLPGLIVGRVREPVYDSATGRHLLLPQGTLLTARYDADVSYGQKRVLVVWDQLQRADGFYLELGGMSGVDQLGRAGYEQELDTHAWTRIKGAVLATLLEFGSWGMKDLASEHSMLRQNGLVHPKSPLAYAAQAADRGKASKGLGDTTSSGLKAQAKSFMQVKPTIRIAPGSSVQILVSMPLALPPYRQPYE